VLYISANFGQPISSLVGIKVISVPATEIATEHRAIQTANTAMFGALMQAGNLGLPERPTAMLSG